MALYNLPTPSRLSPAATVTISNGTQTATQAMDLESVGYPIPGAAQFSGSASNLFAVSGAVVTISVSWTDGAGGSGTAGPQSVAVPDCAALPISQHALSISSSAATSAYWYATNGGESLGFMPGQGHASLNYGGLQGLPLNAPIVGMAATPDGNGYWFVGADGGVFNFGLAQFFGSTGALHLNAPIVGMASTPDGGGYWLVAKDGGVFAFGDAPFYGSMGGKPLNKPIVGMAADPATGGYWLVASDGGIFSFNAPFHGSTGSLALAAPIVGMQAAADGTGYRLAASDGGVFSFNLPFEGSYAGLDPHPIVGIAGQGDSGYWLLDNCGGIYSFGSAPFNGNDIVC